MRLAHPPLIFALLDMRTSRVPKMEDHIEEIHAKLLESSLDTTDLQILEQSRLSFNPAEGIFENLGSVKSWHFLDLPRQNSLIVSDSQVTLKQSNYATINEMLDMFGTMLRILHETIPGYGKIGVRRMGLRYIDILMPMEADEVIDSYISKKYTSTDLRAIEGVTRALPFGGANCTTQYGNLRLYFEKMMQVDGKLKILPENLFDPPNVALTPIIQDHWKNIGDREYMMMDSDHYREFHNPEKNDINFVLTLARNLHTVSDALFLDVLNQHALNSYGIIQ